MLAYYLTQTRRLLQNPGATSALYSDADLTSYINTARGQLAGEAECVRALGTIVTVPGTRNYNFSAIVFPGTPTLSGIQGAIHVRRVTYNVGTGQKRLYVGSWEWFDNYYLNNPNPKSGPPVQWAQYGQGSSGVGSITGIGLGAAILSGSLYIDPIPDLPYTLNVDCVCYPIALAADADVEAIPYLFTDSVPFFATYYALLSSQTSARQADGERMFKHYQTFLQRARTSSNPSVNRNLFEQSSDLSDLSKFGMQQGGGGQG